MTPESVFASLSFLEWRDQQFTAVSEQLEKAYPDLIRDLDRLVDSASVAAVARQRLGLAPKAGKLLSAWSESQAHLAMTRAEGAFDSSLGHLPADLHLSSSAWDSIRRSVPAAAGVGMLAASIAAVPATVSFATVPVTFLFFFTTSTISIAVAIGGMSVAAGLAFSGSKVLSRTAAGYREDLRRRLHAEAARRIFGIGGRRGQRCLLNDLQAAVLKAGHERVSKGS